MVATVLFERGSRPVPGYECAEEIAATPVYRLWKMRSAAAGMRLWQIVDRDTAYQVFDLANVDIVTDLKHPHLNPYERVFEPPNTHMLVFESPLHSATWKSRLAEMNAQGKTGLPWRELIEYVKQAATALDYLNSPIHEHQGNVVALFHRNLTPENFQLFRSGVHNVCKLYNYGLAKIASEETTRHSRGLMNYDYDPPEFFEGHAAVTSDQFSLAVNYVEMRTGKRPYTGSLLDQLSQRISNRPNLTSLSPPEQIVLRRALAADPANRFSCCEEFVNSLGTLVRTFEMPSRPHSVNCSSSIFRTGKSTAVAEKISAGQSGELLPVPVQPTPSAAPLQMPKSHQAMPFTFEEKKLSKHWAAMIAATVFSIIAMTAVALLRRAG